MKSLTLLTLLVFSNIISAKTYLPKICNYIGGDHTLESIRFNFSKTNMHVIFDQDYSIDFSNKTPNDLFNAWTLHNSLGSKMTINFEGTNSYTARLHLPKQHNNFENANRFIFSFKLHPVSNGSYGTIKVTARYGKFDKTTREFEKTENFITFVTCK